MISGRVFENMDASGGKFAQILPRQTKSTDILVLESAMVVWGRGAVVGSESGLRG